MMQDLSYPFDGDTILRKKKALRRTLLAGPGPFEEKKIAVLGGSTTSEVVQILELFLLNHGFAPLFYESGFDQYQQEAMFPGEALKYFAPDLIYMHTSLRNVKWWPSPRSSRDEVESRLEEEYARFQQIWESLAETFHCPVIQNNFERPGYRLMGNMDISDFRGAGNYISRLNQKIYDYSQQHSYLHIQDIDFLAAAYGLDKWSDPFFWHMYKYALCLPAIPELAFNLSNIIKAIFGKNKKVLALDLDNTLWGGVIGDDGIERIQIGEETPSGQAYGAFQRYIKAHKDLGVLLTIVSKNDLQAALQGLGHAAGHLTASDFVSIQANWENKDVNLLQIAGDLNLGVDSFVFVDDNPAERELVTAQIPNIAAPPISDIEQAVHLLDRGGYFECAGITGEDAERAEMYEQNRLRQQSRKYFENYEDYLISLSMKAQINAFAKDDLPRITQLINKTNQFNLTAKRYSEEEVAFVADSGRHICLSGRLDDKYGSNGIVSVMIAEVINNEAHIVLWVMSCRVFKRDMELAMMDQMVRQCGARSVSKIYGRYAPTAKNALTAELYPSLDFDELPGEGGGEDGRRVWVLQTKKYSPKNKVITVSNEVPL